MNGLLIISISTEKGGAPDNLRASSLLPVLPTSPPAAAPVPASGVDDSYLEYKHNFASARLRFEAGMSQTDADSNLHCLPRHASLAPPKSSLALESGSVSADVNSTTPHQLNFDLQTSSTTPTTPQGSVLSLDVNVRREAEVQTDLQEAPPSLEPHFVDHGCQTDEELEFDSGPNSLPEPEQLRHEVTHRESPARDQEIQVTQDDLVNPLKRVVSQKTRRYDLLEVPHLKRRVYQRRFTHQQRRRTRSASDVPRQQLWGHEDVAEEWNEPEVMVALRESEVRAAWSKQVAAAWNEQMAALWSGSAVPDVWGRPEVAGMWTEPDMDDAFPECLEEAFPAPSWNFGLSDSTPLVASLQALVQGLPSAYPDALPYDDLADLDHNSFSSLPEDKVHCLALHHVPRSRVASPSPSPVRVRRLGG